MKRFSRQAPCPICGGFPELPQHQGRRCAGFVSDDGRWAYCTREQYAGQLPLDEKTSPPAYRHRLEGPCDCGREHAPDRGRPETPRITRYEIRDRTGKVVAVHERRDLVQDGVTAKRFYWRHPDGRLSGRNRHGAESEAEEDKIRPAQLPLYGAHDLDLHPRANVLIVEGERCRDAARHALDLDQYVPLGTVTGAGKRTHEPAAFTVLQGRRRIILWADHDDPGRDHMQITAQVLRDIGITSLYQVLPEGDPPAGWDLVDYLKDHSAEDLLALLARAAPMDTPPTSTAAAVSAGKDQKDKKPSQATLVTELGSGDAEPGERVASLWHTPDREGWATVLVEGHLEHYPIRSRDFKLWVRRVFREVHGATLSTRALNEGLEDLEATAVFDGREHPVHLRVAEHEGAVWIDLTAPDWSVVRVTPEGWNLVHNPPVRFRRRRGQLPFPVPEKGGSLEDLRAFLNLPDDDDYRLFITCLVTSLRPRGPYVLVHCRGEQGSAKSTACRVFRRLSDPNVTPLRRPPRDDRDLAIAARGSWVIGYDNLSYLPDWLSDALCGMATGGGFATRQLYSDDEEILFEHTRPVLVNGIEGVVTRSDLRERQVVLDFHPIPKDRRLDEAALWHAFDEQAPRLFGAVLDTLASTLAERPRVQLAEKPRMADFALWGVAVERACRWPEGSFLRAYEANLASGSSGALEDSLVAKHVRALAEKGGWRGTASELLALLNSRVPDEVRRDKRWPKAPHALSGRLKREAPDLRELGWAQVRFSQEGHSRMRTISISPVCMEEEKERPQRSSVRAEFEMSGSTRSRASAERPHPAQERPQLYLVPDEDDPPIEDDARPAWLEQEVGPDEIPPPEEVPWSWLDDEEAGT